HGRPVGGADRIIDRGQKAHEVSLLQSFQAQRACSRPAHNGAAPASTGRRGCESRFQASEHRAERHERVSLSFGGLHLSKPISAQTERWASQRGPSAVLVLVAGRLKKVTVWIAVYPRGSFGSCR